MAEANANTTVTDTANNAAENSGGDPNQAVNPQGDNAVSTPESAQAAKFTQKDMDDAIRQRLERERKNMPSKDELKAFRDWKDSQKSAEQLAAEKITAAESAKSDAEKRAEAAEAKCTAYAKGVLPEAVDDVIALAAAKVSDDVTIEQAIDEVIKKYPSFCKPSSVSNTAPGSITTGANFTGGNTKTISGVEAAFLARNPDIKI